MNLAVTTGNNTSMQIKPTKVSLSTSGEQKSMLSDKNKFCKMCNMVFSSPVVATSHYVGKVHSKNLRKQNLKNSDFTIPSPASVAQSTAGCTGEQTERASSAVDLKDPNKYCSLCCASFNNPLMASQHYNGRRHQKNEAKMKQLQDPQVTSPVVNQSLGLQSDSVAHTQRVKLKSRETNVEDKPAQKQYRTFTDELADYIQAQKARGVAPVTGLEAQEEEEEEEEEGQDVQIYQSNSFQPDNPTVFAPSHHSNTAAFCPSWVLQGWYNNNSPAPDSQDLSRKRCRRQSSSSYRSSSFDSSSDTDNGKRHPQPSSRSRESHEAGRRKRRRREQVRLRDKERSKKQKKHKQKTRGEPEQGNLEVEKYCKDKEGNAKTAAELHIQTEINVKNLEGRQEDVTRREKRKSKERVDIRTEEERLWDDSILGF